MRGGMNTMTTKTTKYRIVIPSALDQRIRVEGTDANGNWVDVDPGDTYDSIAEAERAAELWAQSRGGEYIGLV